MIRLDDALMENPGGTTTEDVEEGLDFVTSFHVTVTGASSGNGKFGEADFGYIVLYTGSTGLDLTRRLVGQPATSNPWGNDGCTGCVVDDCYRCLHSPLVNPDTLKCWSSEFATASKNDPTTFAVKAP